MGTKRYSRAHRYGKRRFRYNYESHTLEWIDKGNTVMDAIGLSSKHWEESPKYWIEMYSAQIDEEISWLMRGLL